MTEIRLDSGVAKVIESMLRSDINDVPVVNALRRALADILTASEAQEEPADAEIRKAIAAGIDANGGMPGALTSISVHNGAVQMHGTIPSELHRPTLRAIADRVPGVKALHDHLIWIDRKSGAFLPSPEDSLAA